MKRYWLIFVGIEALFLGVLVLFMAQEMPFWALLALGCVAVLSLAAGLRLLLAGRQVSQPCASASTDCEASQSVAGRKEARP